MCSTGLEKTTFWTSKLVFVKTKYVLICYSATFEFYSAFPDPSPSSHLRNKNRHLLYVYVVIIFVNN